MTWQPGQVVRTQQDEAERKAWRKDRKLAAQRNRRNRLRRIDYQPSQAAAEVIDSLTDHKHTSGVYSSVIDRLILLASGINLPIKKGKASGIY